MNIKKSLKKIAKGLVILTFVVCMLPLFDFWVEYPLFAGTLLIILYFILRWLENHIPYFKKEKEDKRREENKKGI